MRLCTFSLVVVLTVVLGAGGCGPDESVVPETAIAADTATEVALYGLVSWASTTDALGNRRFVALMPNTTEPPSCTRQTRGTRPPKHFPVLKVVTGDISWENDVALDKVAERIFSIDGWQVSFTEERSHHSLRENGFDLLASNPKLNGIRSKKNGFPPQQAVGLDPALFRPTIDPEEKRLGSRVLFSRGRATASAVAYCKGATPKLYRTKAHIGSTAERTCPRGDDGTPTRLADEVVVRLQDDGASLTIHFSPLADVSQGQRRLTVKPSSGGVRIEIGNQMALAAKHLDTRRPSTTLCDHRPDHRDYLWYYDLRPGAGDCPKPALLPCVTGLGGTMCPQNNGGG